MWVNFRGNLVLGYKLINDNVTHEFSVVIEPNNPEYIPKSFDEEICPGLNENIANVQSLERAVEVLMKEVHKYSNLPSNQLLGIVCHVAVDNKHYVTTVRSNGNEVESELVDRIKNSHITLNEDPLFGDGLSINDIHPIYLEDDFKHYSNIISEDIRRCKQPWWRITSIEIL
jgi:hypothetical protein